MGTAVVGQRPAARVPPAVPEHRRPATTQPEVDELPEAEPVEEELAVASPVVSADPVLVPVSDAVMSVVPNVSVAGFP